jgi:hypothetical protein
MISQANLYKSAYCFCIKLNRYDVLHDIDYLDASELEGIISFLSKIDS